jgi:octaprenyl-diphosphate synthase
MNDYKKKALVILKDFPESEYKSSLEAMIAYVVERKI